MKTTKSEENVKIEITAVREFSGKPPKGGKNEVKPYTDDIEKMEAAVDVLDGYDDFDFLKIDGNAYKKDEDTFGYGIKYSQSVHSDGVILRHQKVAASKLLKIHRGFGMLADVVGSGKTFEAGVVLSELAYRGLIGSLLIVVPGEVIDSWQEVLTYKFGLGKCEGSNEDALITIVKKDADRSWKRIPRKDKHPQKPILVDFDTFNEWGGKNEKNQEFSKDCVFDMIIVDEAHELCNANNLKAMGLLSRMIYEKKRQSGNDEGCYCLLLSATPHDGDLKSMFNLWYFIQKNGGIPEEFFIDEQSDKPGKRGEHGDEYKDEYNSYKNNVCYGADNISDFIRKKKTFDFEDHGDFVSKLRERLIEYLQNSKRSIEEFDHADEWEKDRIVSEYFESHPKDYDKEMDDVAKAYRELLGSIMVRQSRKDVVTTSASKKTVNVYFYPVKPKSFADKKLEGIVVGDQSFTVDYSGVIERFPAQYYPEIITKNKQITALNNFLKSDNKTEYKEEYADVISGVFNVLQQEKYLVRNEEGYNIFKREYDDYYTRMLRYFDDKASDVETYRKAEEASSGQFNLFIPYEFASEEDSFSNKLAFTKKILEKHNGERVIIFFDYDLESNEEKRFTDGSIQPSIYAKLENKLREAYPERKIISIDASEGLSNDAKLAFDEDKSGHCILIVKNGYTHGANLQKAAVIINFQVSCSPVEMEQRIGRIYRLGQEKNVTIYSLADMHELEGYSLAYFSRIGLFAVDSGDATILSGCNNSHMVTVRCRECQHTAIMSEAEYRKKLDQLVVSLSDNRTGHIVKLERSKSIAWARESQTKHNEKVEFDIKYLSNELICSDNKHFGVAHLMEPITNVKFECTANKAHRLTRSKKKGDDGYKCMDPNANQTLSTVDGSVWFCNKLCVLSKCPWHKDNFPECKAVELFMSEGRRATARLQNICMECKMRKECEQGCGGFSCLPTYSADKMEKNIQECIHCPQNKMVRCRPKPHVLRFRNNGAETDCPICRAEGNNAGILKILNLDKFSDHVRYLWDCYNDEDSMFCRLLEGEAQKVGELENILQRSGENHNA